MEKLDGTTEHTHTVLSSSQPLDLQQTAQHVVLQHGMDALIVRENLAGRQETRGCRRALGGQIMHGREKCKLQGEGVCMCVCVCVF